jgi:surfeit locus 1 family protein
VLRTLAKPRWLLLLAVLVAVLVTFTRLGLWQLAVARDDAAEQAAAEAAARPVVALEELLAPHAPYTADAAMRRVTVTGTYDVAREFLVPRRLLDGAEGSWVVTPLVVESTGARVPVVRGFLPATEPEPPAAPAGEVTVTGTLAPGESPADGTGLTAGQRGSIDLAALANEWPPGIYSAFVFAAEEDPAPAEAPARIPPPQPSGDVDWRNLGYALQWWVFAGFAVFMYWRLVREDHQRDLAAAAPTLEASEERTTPHHV